MDQGANKVNTTSADSSRYNTAKKCACGVATSVLAAPVKAEWKLGGIRRNVFALDNGRVAHNHIIGCDSALIVECRGCGALRVAKKVYGKFVADKGCDGRCMSATGHNCECSCGGINHGAAHAA
jgi:hypothetical protein